MPAHDRQGWSEGDHEKHREMFERRGTHKPWPSRDSTLRPEFEERRNRTTYDEGPKKHGCYVATEVYGNPFAWQVETYRWLRRRHLYTNRSGKRFTDWYEKGGGQYLSNIAREHTGFRIASRIALDIGAVLMAPFRYIQERRK